MQHVGTDMTCPTFNENWISVMICDNIYSISCDNIYSISISNFPLLLYNYSCLIYLIPITYVHDLGSSDVRDYEC